MADPQGLHSEAPEPHGSRVSSAVSQGSEAYPDIPAAFLSDPRGLPCPTLTYRADAELRSLLQALPTRADIEALIGRVEEMHRQELRAVKTDVQALTTRLATGESTLSMLEQRMTALKSLQGSHTDAAMALQLHLEDIEDRNHRNNLQLRGLPRE